MFLITEISWVNVNGMRSVSDIEYLNYLDRSGKSSASRLYEFQLQHFKDWLKHNTTNTIDTFNANDYSRFLNDYTTNHYTANAAKYAIIGYCKYRQSLYDFSDPMVMFEKQRLDQIENIKIPKKKREYKKVSLEPDDAREFFGILMDQNYSKMYSYSVLYAYFGARPIEIEQHLFRADIDWNDNSMVILTAKTGEPRFLCWDSDVTPHIKEVIRHGPPSNPGEYYTAYVRYMQKNPENQIKGISVTAKTWRKTFQTQMRIRNVGEMYIDAALGHTMRNIGDVYMDFSSAGFRKGMREMMTNKHYLLGLDVL